MATATQVGQAGLQGWREKVADGVAEPVAKRVNRDEEEIRAVIGIAFLVLSVFYIVKAVTTIARELRET